MSISQSLRNSAVVVEKYVTLAATSGTTVGPAVPAGTIILAAGFEAISAVPNVDTTYTVAVGADSGAPTMAATSIDAAAAGTVVAGVTPKFVAAADTVDAVTVISGNTTNATVTGRVWAVIVDVNGSVGQATTVDRDILA